MAYFLAKMAKIVNKTINIFYIKTV